MAAASCCDVRFVLCCVCGETTGWPRRHPAHHPRSRHAPHPSLTHTQTRRLTKFPDAIRHKCESFQLKPPRHAIPRDQTRQKLPDLDVPPEVWFR